MVLSLPVSVRGCILTPISAMMGGFGSESNMRGTVLQETPGLFLLNLIFGISLLLAPSYAPGLLRSFTPGLRWSRMLRSLLYNHILTSPPMLPPLLAPLHQLLILPLLLLPPHHCLLCLLHHHPLLSHCHCLLHIHCYNFHLLFQPLLLIPAYWIGT